MPNFTETGKPFCERIELCTDRRTDIEAGLIRSTRSTKKRWYSMLQTNQRWMHKHNSRIAEIETCRHLI